MIILLIFTLIMIILMIMITMITILTWRRSSVFKLSNGDSWLTFSLAAAFI